MTEPSAITEAQFSRLRRSVLNNPSASVRKEALLDIRKLDHPGVMDVLRQVLADDKDAEVRDLAQNLLRKREIDEAVKRGSFEDVSTPWDSEAPTPPAPTPDWLDQLNDEYEEVENPPTPTLGELIGSASGDTWACRFCGIENTGGDRCSSCGAHRDAAERSVEAPRKPRPQPQRVGDTSASVFLLQAHNQKFLNGTSKQIRTSMGSMGVGCLSLFMLPFVVIGVVVIGLGIDAWNNYNLLNTTGVETHGTYSGRHYETDDDDGSTTYYAEYYFKVDGTTYSNSHSVSHDLYNRVERGGSVDILYAPSNPDISRIAGTNDLSEVGFFALFGTIWNGVTWVFIIGIIFSVRRNRTLAREGQLVRGQILSAKGSSQRTNHSSNYTLTVEYSFDPPDGGATITKKQSSQRNDLRRQPLPEEGTPVAVLYRNRNHFKML